METEKVVKLKTRQAWLDEMTEETKRLFLSNITPAQRGAIKLNTTRIKLKTFVFEAFYWHGTKQGFEYWSKIANS